MELFLTAMVSGTSTVSDIVKMKVTQWYLTLCDPMTIQSMEFSQPEYQRGQPFPSPGDLPNPGIEPRSPTLQEDSLPYRQFLIGRLHIFIRFFHILYTLPHFLPYRWFLATREAQEYWSLSLLQGIFPTQESNRDLLHCRQILYQLSCCCCCC